MRFYPSPKYLLECRHCTKGHLKAAQKQCQENHLDNKSFTEELLLKNKYKETSNIVLSESVIGGRQQQQQATPHHTVRTQPARSLSHRTARRHLVTCTSARQLRGLIYSPACSSNIQELSPAAAVAVGTR